MFDQNKLAYIVTMTSEQDHRTDATAFGLIRVTPDIQRAIDQAYHAISEGGVGEVEIPVDLPVIPARRQLELRSSAIPHAGTLRSGLALLAAMSEWTGYPVGEKVSSAFTQFTSRPAKAALLVSRDRAPRLRTCVRGGKTRYISAPIQELAVSEPAHPDRPWPERPCA